MAHFQFVLAAVTVVLVVACLLCRFVFGSRTARDLVWRIALIVVATTPLLAFVRAALPWQWTLAVLPGETAIVDPVESLAPPPRSAVTIRRMDRSDQARTMPIGPAVARSQSNELPIAIDATPATTTEYAAVAYCPAASNEPFDDLESAINSADRWSWPRLVAVAWLAGSILQGLRILRAMWSARRLAGSSEPVSEPALNNLNTWTARRVGVGRPARLLASSRVGVPVVSGIWRPAIVIPPALTADDARPQLRAALLHEYGHVRRHDVAFDLVLRIVVAAFWPHPLVHWMAREIGRLREEICDNFVLAEESPAAYSEMLLRLSVGMRLSEMGLVGLGMFTRQNRLEARIDALLAPGRSLETAPPRATRRLLLAGTSAAILAALAVRIEHATAAPPAVSDQPPAAVASDKSEASEPATPIGRKPLPILVIAADGAAAGAAKDQPGATAPKAPREFRFRIVNSFGKPVDGATATIQWIHIGAGSVSIPGTPFPSATSDSEGWAVFSMPPEIDNAIKDLLQRAGLAQIYQVYLKVDHPDYPHWSSSHVATEQTIVLSDPFTIQVRARQVGQPVSAKRLYPDLSPGGATDWKEVDGRIVIRRVDLTSELAARWLRIVHVPESGPAWFSDEVDLKHLAGNPIELELELKESVRVQGVLGEMVPRPIKNGYVNAMAADDSIAKEEDEGRLVNWSMSVEIAADGTFVLESLPANARHLQVIAVCDGWVSRSPTTAELKTYSAVHRFPKDVRTPPSAGMVHPQLYPLYEKGRKTPIIAMEPTAACEVTVVDGANQPVADAAVSFFPNQFFHGWGSSLICRNYNQVARIREVLDTGDHDAITMRPARENESVTPTNAEGKTLVTGLPGAGNDPEASSSAMFLVMKAGYVAESNHQIAEIQAFEMPMLVASLTPGKTERITVRMKPQAEIPFGDVPAAEGNAAAPAAAKAKNDFRGRVVNEKGEPLEGVEVLVFNQDCFNIRTDKEGRFHHTLEEDFFSDTPTHPFAPPELVPQDQIAVRFVKPGYAPQTIQLRVINREHTVTLETRTYFEGIVRMPDGKPAKNVLVRGHQEGQMFGSFEMMPDAWADTLTDERGYYRLLVQEGTYVISAGYPAEFVAWLPKREAARGDSDAETNRRDAERPRIFIGPNEVRKLDFDLERGVDFQVRVIDSQTGRPVPKVHVHQSEFPNISSGTDDVIIGQTDENGEATIRSLPPGEIEFNVHTKDYLRSWSDAAAPRWKEAVARQRAGQPAQRVTRFHDGILFDLKPGMPMVTISLEPPVTINGRVLDPEGQPVAGAIVRLVRPSSDVSSSDQDEHRERTETQEDGRFSIRLPPSDGRPYSLMAHDGSKHRTDPAERHVDKRFDRYEWRTWANGVGPTLETTAGQTIDNIELRLTRPGTIRGRLVDKAGKPVARSPVHCVDVDNREGPYHHPIGRSDGEGRFEIRFVRPGRHQILRGRPNGRAATTASQASLPIVEVQSGETTDAGDVATTP